MSKCDECKVRKYCDDFVCLGGITCDETRDMIEQIRNDTIEECARTIEVSKTLFENHQTENVMGTKDRCIVMIRNLKEQKE